LKRRIVLLGPPASGKGTQAELIEKKFRLPGTSTGAILRHAARTGNRRGLVVHDIISKGGFAPDDLVLEVVDEWLERSEGAFLFDGFPRTLRQAEEFDRILEKRQWPLELVIYLKVSLKTIYERTSRRLTCRDCGKIVSKKEPAYQGARNDGTQNGPVNSDNLHCPNCGGLLERRPDDDHDVIDRRMKEFEAKTFPIIEFYQNRGLLIAIDSEEGVEKVFQTISEAIEA
jgi:adenylate kinase